MISQSCVKEKKKKKCQFSISSLASNQKNVKGFKSEASANESKNLIHVIKLHTVKAFRKKKQLYI